MKTVSDRLTQWVGKNVLVEGLFPIPHNNQVAYSPAMGKLVAVYADGFDLLGDGEAYPQVFLLRNIRSVVPAEKSGIVTPPRLFTGA